MIIDTHAHLTSHEFKEDLPLVLEQAWELGVELVITVGEDLDDSQNALELSRQFSSIRAGAGLFPTVLDLEELERVAQFIRENSREIICIGEVGLDFWKVKGEKERAIQEEIFRGFIRLSKETGLPLNCHSRSAGKRLIEILLEEGATRVQLHAFDAKPGTALKAQDAGFFFSIPPSVVRSRQKQRLVRALDLGSILIETDSPVLGPHKGERNAPSNARVSIKAIADIKGEAPEKVEAICLENTKRLYGDCL